MKDEKKTAPVLRFNGFSDAWELRKLSDIVVRLSKSSINNQLPKVEFEDVIAGEGRLNKDVSHKFDDRKGILFEPNNILYGKLRPYLKNWLLADFKGIALGDFWVFKPINSEPKFIYCLIQSDNYQRVANDTSGTKMPRSDWKKVSSSYFSIPRSIEEQEKIGNLFKQLDNTITLHQRKLDKLKLLKQGYLQQLFPQNDEKVPRFRFANFDENWEQRKLGSLSENTFGGGTPKTKVLEYWSGTIPWIQSSDLENNKLFNVLPKKYITENAVKNSATKIVPSSSIVIVTRVGVGKLAFMTYEYTTSQDFLSLSNLNTDGIFSTYAIYKLLQKELNNIQGTSIKGITKTDLLEKI
jgi:Restriction endonuclease S subunits